MEWTDEGIVLGTRRHGEANAIVELMTRGHGRHLGLVRGGAGSRLRPILQVGNSVRAVWRARLDEHLGHFAVEGLELRAAALFGLPHAIYGVAHLAALCRLLPERDPHLGIYESVEAILEQMDDPLVVAGRLVRFELALLAELGFGLDLDTCAATGTDSDLAYVSPKSGRAVSREAGAPWHEKLLRLPAFIGDASVGRPSPGDIADGFALTAFFLGSYVLEPRGLVMDDARASFIGAVMRASVAA